MIDASILAVAIVFTVWLLWLTRKMRDAEKHRVSYINKRIGDHGLRLLDLELRADKAERKVPVRARKAAK